MPKHFKPRDGRKCAFPGCGNDLTEANTTGLCKRHNHAKDLCKCFQCMGQHGRRKVKKIETAPPPPPKDPARKVSAQPGMVVREIPYPSTNSTAALRMPVTMSAFPWEKPNVVRGT